MISCLNRLGVWHLACVQSYCCRSLLLHNASLRSPLTPHLFRLRASDFAQGVDPDGLTDGVMLLSHAYGEAVLSMFVAVIGAMVVRGIKRALVGRGTSTPGRFRPPASFARKTRNASCSLQSRFGVSAFRSVGELPNTPSVANAS